MRNFMWNQRVLGGRQGLAGGSGMRNRAGTPSLLQIVQQSRQKHLQLLRDDIKSLVNFADTLAGRVATRGNVYDVQAVEGDTTTTTTTTTATTADSYAIDAASLRTVVAGTVYTINGSVTGPAAGQSRIRVWLGNPTTAAKLLDPTYGSETLVSGNLVIELPSGNNTFSLAIDLVQLPANASKPPSAASPWVITASATSGDDESDPVLVPVSSAAAFVVDPTLLTATLAGNIITITGTVKEPSNIPAVIRVRMGTAGGQKLVSPTTFAETLISSAQVALASGMGNFSLAVSLAALPAGASAPTSTNPWVITACDQTGGFETSPLIVPSASAAPVPATAAYTLDATSLKAVLASNVITLTGTVKEPSNATGVVRVWMGTPSGTKAISSTSLAETLVGSAMVPLAGGIANFSLAINLGALPAGASAPTTSSPWVITVCDTTGGAETPPILVPAATAPRSRLRIIYGRCDRAQSRRRKQRRHRLRNRPRPCQHAGRRSDLDGDCQWPEAHHRTVVRRDAGWRDDGDTPQVQRTSRSGSTCQACRREPRNRRRRPRGSSPRAIRVVSSKPLPVLVPTPVATTTVPPPVPAITTPAAGGVTVSDPTFDIKGTIAASAAKTLVQAACAAARRPRSR